MALQIINAGPPPETIAQQIHEAIAGTLPDATIEVRAAGPGHFEITVTDAGFEGLSRVKQQQRVYGAITDFMSRNHAPVHALDRLECLLPCPDRHPPAGPLKQPTRQPETSRVCV